MSKRKPGNLLLAALPCVGLVMTSAVAQISAQEQAANLRLKLAEVQVQQAEQQEKLQQLEEALKPENIERSVAGVGSTHPEELREQRRRQLEREKTGVRALLDQLAASRTRLEAAVAAADARAYHESAKGPEGLPATEPANSGAAVRHNRSIRRTRRKPVRRTTRKAPPPPAKQ